MQNHQIGSAVRELCKLVVQVQKIMRESEDDVVKKLADDSHALVKFVELAIEKTKPLK